VFKQTEEITKDIKNEATKTEDMVKEVKDSLLLNKQKTSESFHE